MLYTKRENKSSTLKGGGKNSVIIGSLFNLEFSEVIGMVKGLMIKKVDNSRLGA